MERKDFVEMSQAIRRDYVLGRMNEAESKWRALVPATPVEHRITGYWEGRLAMAAGRFQEAAQVFESTKTKYGNHVSLLQDLASAHYLAGHMDRWIRAVSELEAEFERARLMLTPEGRARVLYDLAKFREEEGDIPKGIELYEAALEELKRHEATTGQRPTEGFVTALLSQIIRARSVSGMKRGLSEVYTQLLHAIEGLEARDLFLEIEHALILAEHVLVGPAQALARLEKLMAREDLPDHERRLIFFDVIEMELAAGRPAQALLARGIRNWQVRPENFNAYERRLQQLLDEQSVDPGHLIGLSRGVSPASWLKLLAASLRVETNAERRELLRHQFALLIERLDRAARQTWFQRAGEAMEESGIQIELDLKAHTLSCGHRMAEMSRRQTLEKLLAALAETGSLEMDQLVARVWDAEFNASYLDRVRMLVRRGNEFLLDLSGTAEIMIFRQGEVKLRPGVKILRNAEVEASTPQRSH